MPLYLKDYFGLKAISKNQTQDKLFGLLSTRKGRVTVIHWEQHWTLICPEVAPE